MLVAVLDSASDEPLGELATTDMIPPLFPEYAVIELVVDEPVHPAGNVHVYDVAPVAAGIEYIAESPLHRTESPEIGPGITRPEHGFILKGVLVITVSDALDVAITNLKWQFVEDIAGTFH